MKTVISVVAIFFTLSSFAESETKRFPFNENGLLKIKNSSGNITIRQGSEKEVVVTLEKVEFGKHCSLDFENKEDKELLIKIRKTMTDWLSKDCKVNLSIVTPQRISQTIKNGSGDIAIRGTHGDISIKTGSGDIAIQASAKNFSGKTGSGNVTIKGLLEKVNIKTGSGHINAKLTQPLTSDGHFNVKTGSGDIILKTP